MYYILVISIQLFCLYHAYTRQVPPFWFFVILFFPVIGCVIYLFKHFNTPEAINTLETVVEEVKGSIDNTYTTRKLEKQLDFSDTVQNKLILGSEYLRKGNFEDAYALFESCNKGIFENDPEVLAKLVETSFLVEDYEATVKYGNHPNFMNDVQNLEEKTDLAWAYHYSGKEDEATVLFKTFDKSYGNYYQRHEYIKYLLAINQVELANEKMNNLTDEIDGMDRLEKRINTQIISDIKMTEKGM